MDTAINNAGGFKVYEPDGIHLTEAGYDVVGDAWANAILADVNDNELFGVPEPSTYALFIGGALALFAWRKLRRA